MELRHKKEALARAGVEQGSRKLTTALPRWAMADAGGGSSEGVA